MTDPIIERVLTRVRRDLSSLDNTARGTYAEELVASLLPGASTRVGWADYDIDWDGLRIEVKTSGLVQSWHRHDDGPASPRFVVGARRGWNPSTNELAGNPSRASDVYVFCLHEGADISDGWTFFVVATRVLDDLDQASLGLSTLREIAGGSTPAASIPDCIRAAATT